MLLEGKNLTFAYDRKKGNILTNVSLRIDSREPAAIVGPSGFGKTARCFWTESRFRRKAAVRCRWSGRIRSAR